MNADQDEQEDELLALQSIFGSEEFVRYESEFAGEIQVLIDLPVDFNVLLKHGKTRRQDAISFLPPLLLTFELPADYPSSSPPSFTLTCSWLTHTQLGSLSAQLIDLYQATEGSVVLFSWIQFLREDALKLLNIHSLLELPSDQPSTMSEKQDKQDNSNTPKSEPTDVPGLCGPDKSASSEDVLLNSSSATKKPDFHGASSLDSHKANKDDFNQSSLNSEFKTDYPNALSSETKTQNAHGSEATAFQTSEFKADNQNDLSSAADKSELLPFSEFVQINREDVLSKSDVSASVMPPSSSSNLQYPSEKEPASLPVQATKMSLNNGQTFSGFSITPSQKLLSQILIYNAEQKQRVFATTVFNCSVCYMDWLGSECVQLYECGHIFCRVCLRDFCKVQITEGNVQGVICPQEGCTVTPTPAQLKNLIGEELFSTYDRLLLQSTLDRMSDVTYCPRRSCSSPVISEKSSRVAMCSVCSFAFCVNCKKTYHGTNKCYEEDYKARLGDLEDLLKSPQSEEGRRALLEDYATGSEERRHLLESRYGKKMLLFLETNLSENWKVVNTKACPHCLSPIQKDGGCNMMWCTYCRQSFIWIN